MRPFRYKPRVSKDPGVSAGLPRWPSFREAGVSRLTPEKPEATSLPLTRTLKLEPLLLTDTCVQTPIPRGSGGESICVPSARAKRKELLASLLRDHPVLPA